MSWSRRWKPYVPVEARRNAAEREVKKRQKAGQALSPVVIEGNTITKTFWGKSWCRNLESYSDYSNRLPRGRTYVRNGSVLDLQITPGKIMALVSGSHIYTVELHITALPPARWAAIRKDCLGAIDSLVELLQGRFSKGVMQRLCEQKTGLFPSPNEIKLSCSCPDWASMCKHVAAVLYGVGARLDERPELLFRLREVNEKDLISAVATNLPLAKPKATSRIIEGEDLAELFGLEIAMEAPKKPAKTKAKPVAPVAIKAKKPASKTKTGQTKTSKAKTSTASGAGRRR